MRAPPPSPSSSIRSGTLAAFTPPSTPAVRLVPPAPPSPATSSVMPPVVIRIARRDEGPSARPVLTRRFGPVWCLAAAFALGATIAAAGAIAVDRGAIRVAAAASLVAGVLSVFAIPRSPSPGSPSPRAAGAASRVPKREGTHV